MKAPPCDIVIVIPVFKQPAFLVEALECVRRQRGSSQVRAVVVDDGCPFPETQNIGNAYARASDGRIAYLRRKNGGLSAARNAGITFALQAFPDFKYLYLLDADNRISPDTMERMRQRLDSAGPEVGWVYPDIDMFGYRQCYSNSGDYSFLAHILENYCEAGSFISRKLIDAGVRFDEAMRFGFEDWEFWLQAASKGFRGVHISDSGFQYRRRAESMLVGSERMRETIIDYMRVKHAKLLRPQSLIKLEEVEAPRFIHYQLGSPDVRAFVDPRRPPRLLDKATAARDFARAYRYPKSVYFPDCFLFSAPGALELLTRAGLDRALLWMAQNLLRERHFVVVNFQFTDKDRLGLTPRREGAEQAGVLSARLIIGRADLMSAAANDPNPAWISSILGENQGPLLASIACLLPESLREHGIDVGNGAVALDLLATVATLGERLRSLSDARPEWREDARRSRGRLQDVYSFNFPCGNVLPHVAEDGRKQVGFILPLMEFGGVEKVVLNYARVFRDRGCDVHLFIVNETEIGLASQAREIFASVNFLAVPGAGDGDWNKLYYGAGASQYAADGDTREAVGLLATMDIVLNTHSLAGHAIMASLRKQGIRTYVGLHLVERSRHGQPMGNPNLALPYEHVYDGFVVISDLLARWCLGRAIPAEKIVLARNAASYACPPGAAEAAIALRGERRRADSLRVLYLGRLDAQKGIDRLHEIMRATNTPDFEWRVVGKAILADAEGLVTHFDVAIEPPVFTGEELNRLYAWADVFVLPSRFEGVPLTILEAQRMGCIPVATKVGAVAEIIQDGVDGFLVDNENPEASVVADFVSILNTLAANRNLVSEIAQRAFARQTENNWRRNLESWFEHAGLSQDRSAHV
ncbi:MAG: glycosyltransferase [Alphaproteobacteria bacterium]|nr:glycosyltransferase [Alphaproteobacteria bacterium]